MKIMAVVKSAPLAKSDLAIALAAYEQDEDAAPKTEATARVFGR
jgi:hypothetical protein